VEKMATNGVLLQSVPTFKISKANTTSAYAHIYHIPRICYYFDFVELGLLKSHLKEVYSVCLQRFYCVLSLDDFILDICNCIFNYFMVLAFVRVVKSAE